MLIPPSDNALIINTVIIRVKRVKIVAFIKPLLTYLSSTPSKYLLFKMLNMVKLKVVTISVDQITTAKARAGSTIALPFLTIPIWKLRKSI